MSVYEVEAPTELPGEVSEREQRARTLEAAALEIEVRGWAQGTSRADDGSTCLLGSIAMALGYEIGPGGLDSQVSRPVVRAWGRFPEDLTPIQWNDKIARSADEVTMVLRWRADEVRRGVA